MDKTDTHKSRSVEIGKIVRPHGLHGAVKIIAHNPSSDIFKKGLTLFVDGNAMIIEYVKLLQKAFVVKFESVMSIDDAERLRNKQVSIPYADLPDCEPDTFYVIDLVGLTVVLESGEALGKITDVVNQSDTSVLIVTGKSGEYYIPFLKSLLMDVQLSAKKVVMSQEVSEYHV